MSTSPDISQTAPVPSPDLPEWFRKKQEDAWTLFQSLPAPDRTTETWRYGNVKNLDLSGLQKADLLPTAVELDEIEEGEAYLFFSNGYFVSSSSALPEGVLVLPLSAALKEVPDLVGQYFMQDDTKLGGEKYAALHAAHVTDGVFIYVPDGIRLDKTIQITHFIGGSAGVVFPHTLIVCGENAAVTVMEEFSGDFEEENFLIAVNDLVALPGSELKYALFQNLNDRSRFLQINSTRAEKDATVTNLILNLGAAWCREETTSRLLGENARSVMLSASIADSSREVDQRTFQHHAVARTQSDLLYKNTLFSTAKTTFSGMILVDQGAHFTDAYQTCRNLILSDDAEANSLPGLEINADQVKCSHGTTNSTIEDDQIFYLLSRGISPDRARELIAKGFNKEVLERFGNADVEEEALERIDDKFEMLKA